MRVEGAIQCMIYDKMLRLRNGGEAVLSQAITFCTNDQERIFECVTGGVLAFGQCWKLLKEIFIFGIGIVLMIFENLL